MPVDFINCNNNSLPTSPKAILGSLINKVTASGCNGFRIEKVTLATCTPIQCQTHEQFWDLFIRALGTAGDGKIVLRVTETTARDGAGLEEAQICNGHISLDDLMSSIFVTDSDGYIAVNILNVT